MRFLSKLDDYYKILKEQPEAQDAAAPDPNTAPVAAPATPNKPQQVSIAPEGYVNIVRMLAKALVMNIPASEIDTLLTGQEINKENAVEIQKGLDAVMKDNEVKEDNMERLDNPNYKNFINSINEKNFMQKYEQILDIMKKQSPYIK